MCVHKSCVNSVTVPYFAFKLMDYLPQLCTIQFFSLKVKKGNNLCLASTELLKCNMFSVRSCK